MADEDIIQVDGVDNEADGVDETASQTTDDIDFDEDDESQPEPDASQDDSGDGDEPEPDPDDGDEGADEGDDPPATGDADGDAAPANVADVDAELESLRKPDGTQEDPAVTAGRLAAQQQELARQQALTRQAQQDASQYAQPAVPAADAEDGDMPVTRAELREHELRVERQRQADEARRIEQARTENVRRAQQQVESVIDTQLDRYSITDKTKRRVARRGAKAEIWDELNTLARARSYNDDDIAKVSRLVVRRMEIEEGVTSSRLKQTRTPSAPTAGTGRGGGNSARTRRKPRKDDLADLSISDEVQVRNAIDKVCGPVT